MQAPLAVRSLHFVILWLRHVQVLDYHLQAEPLKRAAAASSQSGSAGSQRSSNLRKADLSYNCIDHISSLSQHSNLQELLLAGNQLKRIGSRLESLRKLQKLDLSSNSIRSCDGLQGGRLLV
jgi:Leucine-rich repeat (LRR) protein